MSTSKTPMKEHLEDTIDDARIDALVRRAPVLHTRRRTQRRVAGISVVSLALLSVVAVKSRTQPSAMLRLSNGSSFESIQPSLSSRELQLTDGSALTVRENTAIQVRQSADGRAVVFALERGSLTTRLRPGRAWKFELSAGIVVTASRTPLDLEITHDAMHNALVRVNEGTVVVDQPRPQGELLRYGQQYAQAGAHVELHRGETYRMVFDLPVVAVSETQTPARRPAAIQALSGVVVAVPPIANVTQTSTTSSNTAANSPSVAHVERAPAWRSIARTGAYDLAYDSLGTSTVAREATRTQSAEGLWALSEVARLSGHPSEAVAPLQRLLETHSADSQAPVAAFTLGRVQLNSLHNPTAAAVAFERAISLGVPSALEQNAYVLLVQARAGAGDRVGAQDAARRYRERFPTGEQLSAVQRALERLR